MNLKTMGLSNDQIQKIVKSRPSQQEIQRGRAHQNRLRFHSVPVLNEHDFSEDDNDAYQDFTRWVGKKAPELLPEDKFSRFLQLLQLPIPTNELTEGIYDRLHKVFHSQDAFFNYDFISPELTADWSAYRDTTFWATKGFHAMQSAIDSVWVVDLPEFQSTPRPEPFNRLIDISNVIDIHNDDNLNCIYVIYQLGEFVVSYDNETIKVYTAKGGALAGSVGGVSISAQPIKEIAHGLGYTPARQFWSNQLNPKNFINREAPITKELADLDWLLFHMTSKKYMDLSNAYPVTVVRESDDDSDDPDRTENKDRTNLGKRSKGNKLAGAGSVVEIPNPRGPDEQDLVKDAVQFISPDVKTLSWHVDEETRLRNKIYRSVVGVNQDILNDAPKNEKQIDSAFESQLSVLFRIKANFEIINKFADSTIARLRYGDSFLGCQIDYGTKFFLQDIDELHEEFTKAKEGGASEAIQAQIHDNILDTKYKNDRHSRQRAEVIRHLDPLPDKNIDEAIQILDKGGIGKINFIIKSNLIKFVQRFERENISLADFAKELDFSKKIETILNRFKDYANESEQSTRDPDQGD